MSKPTSATENALRLRDAGRLRHVALTLLGAEWSVRTAHVMAALLAIDSRTVERWANGTRTMPADPWHRLEGLLLRLSREVVAYAGDADRPTPVCESESKTATTE